MLRKRLIILLYRNRVNRPNSLNLTSKLRVKFDSKRVGCFSQGVFALRLAFANKAKTATDRNKFHAKEKILCIARIISPQPPLLLFKLLKVKFMIL